ncbi:unnamed protein product [Bursaphelenchus xylophilus]|uniref:Galactosylgalactosylxylosylprotein 3-beta-glucuronosyltransferase n=1 Tax=Bursaphelenchus xylophilus TaxID=6326 RepID=A0A1I7S5I7_BURXY|nr:unnamed protein product [Bursaphelenchus xylophilus]CAG9124751.1 unnamed protein product [Bursaphelenchus xylophilus]
MRQMSVPYYTSVQSGYSYVRQSKATTFVQNARSLLYHYGLTKNKQSFVAVIMVMLLIFWGFRLLRPPERLRQIVIITPTMQRPERIADLTMLSQTLSQVPNIHWILVEDGDAPNPIVPKFLSMFKIPYTYLHTTNQGLPCRGWAQRNVAMDYLRRNRGKFADDTVVYFGDDDNSYDLRLFERYIRKVDYMGVWAVGLPGNALVEHPLVKNGKVVGWHSAFRPDRNFGTDMAGFALNIDVIVKSNASFNLHCAGTMPEDCLLTQMKIDKSRITPFGWEGDEKEILIWHRKTEAAPNDKFPTNGYLVEDRRPPSPLCVRFKGIVYMTYPQALLVAKLYNTTEAPKPFTAL